MAQELTQAQKDEISKRLHAVGADYVMFNEHSIEIGTSTGVAADIASALKKADDDRLFGLIHKPNHDYLEMTWLLNE